MSQEYALDLLNSNVQEFLESRGIIKAEIQYKYCLIRKFKDFAEPGLALDRQKVRYKYHCENIKSIIKNYKDYMAQRNSIAEENSLSSAELKQDINSLSLLNLITSKTPKLLKTELSTDYSRQLKSPKRYKSDNAIQREKSIQEKLKNKRNILAKNFEIKKHKQIKKFKEIESLREKKNQELIEKILNRDSFHFERYSKKSENYLKNNKKKDKIKEIQEKNEKLHEEYIAKSIEKFTKREEKIKKKLKEEMFLKTEKARSMSGNLSEKKKYQENEKIEADFRNFIEKLNKNTEKKKQIEAALNYSIKIKKTKEKNRENEVKKRLDFQHKELQKKLAETGKNFGKNLEKLIKEKSAKQKNLIVQHELEALSARTRLSRINSKFVKIT